MESVPYGILMQPATDAAKFADSVNRFSGVLIEMNAREEYRQATAMRLAAVSKYALGMSERVDEIMLNAERGSAEDIDKYRTEISDAFTAAYDGIQTEAASDPLLKYALAHKHYDLQLHYGGLFKKLTKQKNDQSAISIVHDTIRSQGKKFYTTESIDDEAMTMTLMQQAIDRAEISGALLPDAANKQRDLLEDMVVNKEVMKVTRQIDSLGARDYASRMQLYKDLMDPTKYTKITDPKHRLELREKTLKAINDLESVGKQQFEKGQEDSENEIMDILSQAHAATDPRMRTALLAGASQKLTEAGTARMMTAKKREDYMKMVRDFAEGKFDATNPEIQNDALLAIFNGQMSLTEYRRMRGVSAPDKAATLKLIYGIQKQAAATEKGNLRWNLSEMLQHAKPTGTMSKHDTEQFNAFAMEAVKQTAQGKDPWDTYNSLYPQFFPKAMPTIVIPGHYAAKPNTRQDLENLKLWIPKLIESGDTAKANELAEQIMQADRVMTQREQTEARRKSTEPVKRRTK